VEVGEGWFSGVEKQESIYLTTNCRFSLTGFILPSRAQRPVTGKASASFHAC